MDSTIDLCTIPAAVSPDGVYNFIDPPTLGPAVVAVGVTLAVISTTFAVARLFINRGKLHSADCKLPASLSLFSPGESSLSGAKKH